MEIRHESFDLLPSARSAMSPQFRFSEEEPLQIGQAHLTHREWWFWIVQGLCIYCGEVGHMVLFLNFELSRFDVIIRNFYHIFLTINHT